MTKRFWCLALTIALIGGVFGALPATAQTAIPDVVQIDDPFGDVTPADYSTVGDLGKVWFSHAADTVSVHVQTEGAPPATQAVAYSVYTTPGEGFPEPEGCLRFVTYVPGNAPTWEGGQFVKLIDRCNDGTSIFTNGVEGEAVIETVDGTGVITMTFPRSYSPLLADGEVISKPYARSDIAIGSKSAGQGVRQAMDTTAIGTDYSLTSGEVAEEPPAEEKPKPKGKAKGKKKPKPKKPPAAAACPPFTPAEQGAEAETKVVTDAATADAPVTVELTSGPGGPQGPGPASAVDLRDLNYVNVQVDSAAPSASLNVRVDFPDRHDFDLYVYKPDGSEADHSGDFNTLAEGPHTCGGTSCDSGAGHEAVLGLATDDCSGYTAEIAGYLTTGGAVTVSLWLGDAAAEPAATTDSMSWFYEMMGL